MKRALFLVFLIATPSLTNARTMDNYYAEMRDAAERCESAWFSSSRKEALDDLERAGLRLTTRLNPLSRDFEQHLEYVREATEELSKCSERVYGE